MDDRKTFNHISDYHSDRPRLGLHPDHLAVRFLDPLNKILVPNTATKGGICRTCGDKGWEALLHYCVICHISAEHRYCYAEIPADFDANYPYECDQCVRKSLTAPSSSNQDSAEDVMLICPKDSLAPSSSNSIVPSSSNPEYDEDRWQICPKRPMPPSSLQASENVIAPSSSKTVSAKEMMRNLPYRYPKPFLDHSWRGCLEISGSKLDGLVAHLSNNASFKVAEETKKMPYVIRPVVFRRLRIWPKSFMEKVATDTLVTLHIFPGLGCPFEEYDHVVKLITDTDTCLMVLLQDLELLIFPSIHFPITKGHQLFERKFLWGAFRARKSSLTSSSVKFLK